MQIRPLHAKTGRECEKPMRIGVAQGAALASSSLVFCGVMLCCVVLCYVMRIGMVWSGRSDIQPVCISIVPFGLPGHESTSARLGLRGSRRKS
ncbi:hypothetical protein AVEN_132471-1 [Araneus ventricosus]|uniref:Uncharacterized protein n=1 Tax=Araneus ventricosus TaxID=182803 RepID=A0A4Y2TNI0_ARAVE|nr:hypothetical protein AVEN_132471-1 [Araneus ventricosus]